MADTSNDDNAGKQPVQASGAGSKRDEANISGEVKSNLEQGGESAGGAYPNPHTGNGGDTSPGDFLGHGGQTEQAYHGSGQLGKQKVGDQKNAPSREK